MSGFSFHGVHSSTFGIYTQDQARTILPARREGKITIPGRSGSYEGVRGNVYDERLETILCAFKCPAGKTVPEICREIAYWLSGSAMTRSRTSTIWPASPARRLWRSTSNMENLP